MKVLLLNGSPHPQGCTFTALSEIAATLNQNRIEAEIFQLGTKPIRGCIACRQCVGKDRCVFDDDPVNEFVKKMEGCDGLIVGTPVYYASVNGALISLLLYAVSYDLQKGCVGFFGLDIVKLPDFLYLCKYLAFLGFPSSDFVSADYFPILPWIFLFMAGFYLWNFIAQKNLAKYFEFKIPLFDKIGKYSLWIYLAHQPVIMGVLMLTM